MLNEVFGPLKRAARAIFKDDIRVVRSEAGVRVWLHDGQGPALPPGELEKQRAARREQDLLDRMRREISTLLDDLPGSRLRLKQLAHVEQRLKTEGLTVLQAVPLPLLRLALTQFEGEVVNWTPEGLACLRSKMAVALRDREAAGEEDHGMGEVPSDLPAMTVTEVDVDLDVGDPDEAALLAAYGAVQGTVSNEETTPG